MACANTTTGSSTAYLQTDDASNQGLTWILYPARLFPYESNCNLKGSYSRQRNRLERILQLLKYVVVANLVFLAIALVLPQQWHQWQTGHQEEPWGLHLGLIIYGAPFFVSTLFQMGCWLVASEFMNPKFRRRLGLFVLAASATMTWYFWLLSG